MPPTAFKLDDDSKRTAGTRWPAWCRDLDTYVTASGVKDGGQKRALLLYTMGPATREVYSTLDEKDDDDYEAIKKKLSDHFAPLKNLDFEKFAFSQLRQSEREPLDEYIVRLRVASMKCDFGTSCDEEIERQIIRGCASSKLRQHKLETPGITLKSIHDRARAAEAASSYNAVKSEPIAAVSHKGVFRSLRAHRHPNVGSNQVSSLEQRRNPASRAVQNIRIQAGSLLAIASARNATKKAISQKSAVSELSTRSTKMMTCRAIKTSTALSSPSAEAADALSSRSSSMDNRSRP